MANKPVAEFTQRIVTPLNEDVKVELQTLAYWERTNVSAIVRSLIDGYIKRKAPKHKGKKIPKDK